MIKVKIRKIQADDVVYMVAKELAKEIEKDHKNATCKIHPKRTSYIILTIRGTKTKLSKGSFCCREFSKKVKAG